MFSLFKKVLLAVLPALAVAGTAVALPFVQPANGNRVVATMPSAVARNSGSGAGTTVSQQPILAQGAQPAAVVDDKVSVQQAAPVQPRAAEDDQPVDAYANFKKYYREPNGYTQAPNADLTGLGSVTALSLSGFLPAAVNGTSITITELQLVDLNGAFVRDYRVRRVNYLGPSATAVPSIGTGSPTNNYGLSDNTLVPSAANALLATNISANVSFSLEIELPTPTVLAQINVAQALPATPSGTIVLGSVGVLTTNAAYRLYNYATPANISANTGIDFTVTLGKAASELKWVKFSELGGTTYAYVLVPRTDLANGYWLNRKVLYVTDDEHYLHVTPFAIGGKLNVQLTETQGTPDTADDAEVRVSYYDPSVTDSARVDFLRQINDSEFWRETLLRLRALGNRITDKSLITADMLRNLASTAETGLIFTIKMTGRDGAVAENSLSNMAAFALIGQMSELVFNSVPVAGFAATPFNFSYHINPFVQQWLSVFAGIGRITFAAAGTSNAPKDASNFLITGNFADARWLSAMTRLNTFNLTAYANYQDERSIDEQMKLAEWFSEFLSQQISSSRSPVLLIPRNSANSNNPAVDTKIPSGTITEGVNSGIAPPFYFYTVTTAQYIEYTSIPEPRIFFDPINGLTSNVLLVNDSYVDLFVKDSKLFWNYNQAYKLTGTTREPAPIGKNFIYAFYPKQQKFVTQDYMDALVKTGISSDDFTVLDRIKVEAAPSETITDRPVFEPLLDATNFNQGLKSYFLDEAPLETVLYSSQMILVTEQLNTVAYFYENGNSVHLFSDLTTLLKLYTQDRWPSLGINQVVPSSQPRDAYNLYKQNGLPSFSDPDISVYPINPTIRVNGVELTPDTGIEIFESRAYWKLPAGVTPEMVRYFDGTGYYTDLDDTMNWSAGVNALKPREGYPANVFGTRVTPQHFALTEKNLPQLSQSFLTIANESGTAANYYVILNSGDSFYNFNLNTINYVTEGSGGQVWYTELSQDMVKTIVADSARKLYTVTKELRRNAEPVPIVAPKNGAILRMAGDEGVSYPSVLVNGEWRFWITEQQFNSLNYVDRSGNYYAAIPDVKTAINEAFSTVGKQYDASLYIEQPDSRQNVIQSFEVIGNVRAAQEGFTIDNRRYEFAIKDGKAYIDPVIFELIGFVVDPVQRSYTTSYSQLSEDQARRAFSAIRKPDVSVVAGFKGVDIAPADGERRNIEVRDLNGFLRTTSVVGRNVGGTVVYDFSDVAVGSLIKYKGSENRYLASLDYLQESDGAVSQVLPFTVESLDASKAHQGLAEQADKQIRIVIAGSVLGGLGVLSIAAGAARLYYVLKRRAK